MGTVTLNVSRYLDDKVRAGLFIADLEIDLQPSLPGTAIQTVHWEDTRPIATSAMLTTITAHLDLPPGAQKRTVLARMVPRPR